MQTEVDLNDVRTFVMVAQAKTFSAAAKELGLPTSTITRALTRLETAIGTLLVQRSPKGMTLTEPGEQYLLACKKALRTLRDGNDLLEKHRISPGGLLRISCPVTLARDVLAPILDRFILSHPLLRVGIETYSSDWDQEPREDVDVFFKLKAPKDSGRKVRSFPGTARGLFASTVYLDRVGTPAVPADLLHHACIGSGEWKFVKPGKTVSPEIDFQVITSDPGVHLQLACSGAGIAVLPLWMALRAEAGRSLRRVLPDWGVPPITVCAIYSGSTRLTPKVRVFLDFLGEYFGTERDPRLGEHTPTELFTDLHLPATAGP